MAVPRRRWSKTRRDKRRTHYKLQGKSGTSCPKCGEPKLPHRICRHCGEYKGSSYHVIVTKK